MVSSVPNLKAAAKFDIKPLKSQVVLVGLIVAAIIALVISGGLLAINNNGGYVFFALSATLCVAIVWCWLISQRDTDLAQSHPTKLVLADGANLSADSRLFSSPERVRNVAQLIDALGHRKPLPEPAGLAGPGGVLIPNSSQEALNVASAINVEIQRQHDQVLSLIREQKMGGVVSQALSSGSQSPLNASFDELGRNALFVPGNPGGTES